ncbi:flagellar motor switch protein FliM [Planctomycetales bacterium]|nr:flagellar motor switch protein FliM [Planctomycetales bacterium]GHT46015.1 flagellar motor switch protein FliM [Planctomycetales bacterium]
MAGEVLSQDEVENLLNIMSMSEKRETKPAAAGVAAGAGSGLGARSEVIAPSSSAWQPKEKVTSYDFKRPERVGKEQMKVLQTLHEGFGRKFAAGLAAMLRAIVEVKLTSVDQLTYSEFIFSLENPTCFNLLRAEPLEGNLILDINPAILYPMIDRLLGGGREATTMTRRPLTEIELRLVSRITTLFLHEMKHAWENVLEIDFSVVQVESNPQLIQIVPPNEVVVLLQFEIALIEVRGNINLCIPYNSFERIAAKLTTGGWSTYSGNKKQATPQTIAKVSKAVRDMPVLVKVKLADSKMKIHQFTQLRVGDVIATQKPADTPLLLSIEGYPKFWAKPGKFKGYKAVEIDEKIEDPTNLIAQK